MAKLIPKAMKYIGKLITDRGVSVAPLIEPEDVTPTGIMKGNIKKLLGDALQREDLLKQLNWSGVYDLTVQDVIVSIKEGKGGHMYPVSVILHINSGYEFFARATYNHNGGWLISSRDIVPIAYDLKDDTGAAEQAAVLIDHINKLRKGGAQWK